MRTHGVLPAALVQPFALPRLSLITFSIKSDAKARMNRDQKLGKSYSAKTCEKNTKRRGSFETTAPSSSLLA